MSRSGHPLDIILSYFWPISKSFTNFPCSLYSYLFYFHQLELCFYNFPPKSHITKYRTCVFLPIDITVRHLFTTSIMKCINTWKQKHKTNTKPLLPFTLFPLLWEGEYITSSLSSLPITLPLFLALCPTLCLISLVLILESEVFLAEIVDPSHTTWEMHAGILYSSGEHTFLKFSSLPELVWLSG